MHGKLLTIPEIVESLTPEDRSKVMKLKREYLEEGLSEKEALQEAYHTFYEQECEKRSPEYQDYIEYLEEEYR